MLDNRALIVENPHLRAVTWDNVATILTHDYWHPLAVNGLYRPLTTLSYLLNYRIFGNADRPLGYHVVNLVLHWGCSALSYALMLQLGAVPGLAALTAALFALHPIATEAVTNIVGRADLLAALAVLAGLACHVHACARRGAPRRAWLAALALAALIGVFSKENAAVLLPLAIAWEIVTRPLDSWAERRRRLGASTVILGSVIALMLGVGAWVRANEWVAQSSALDNPVLAAGFWAGRGTALQVLGFQIWQLLWPAALSADYSYNQIPIVTWPPGGWSWAAWITVALVMLAAAWRRRHEPPVAFLIAFFFVALLPTANLFWVIGSIRADRFLYLPLVGFAGAVTAGAWELARTEYSRRVFAALLVAGLLACGWRTAVRNRDWETDETLWRSTVAVAPDSAKARKGYAAAVFARGGEANLSLAIMHAERAVAIRPDYLNALLDLGGYHVARGDHLAAGASPGDAREAYTRAVTLLRRARQLDRSGQRDFRRQMIARGHRRATIPERGSAPLYRNLALAYLRVAELDRAITATRYARRLDPWAVQTWLDLSALEAQRERWDAAAVALFGIVAFERSSREAWTRLAALYQILEPGSTALAADDSGVQVDESAPLVRRHRCRAHAELARIFTRVRLPDVARSARGWVAKNCTPAS